MRLQRPLSLFGVFKPIGHTLVAFRTLNELRAARQTLVSMGFDADALVEYLSEEMLHQTEAEIRATESSADFASDIDLLHARKQLAEQGCVFLIVDAPNPAKAVLVSGLLSRTRPATAQHYLPGWSSSPA